MSVFLFAFVNIFPYGLGMSDAEEKIESPETQERQRRFAEDMEAYRRKQSREAGEEQEERQRQQAVGGGGSWDFSALGYQKDQKTAPEPTYNGISGRVLDTLFTGADDTAQLDRLKEKIGAFISRHEGCLKEYANTLNTRKDQDHTYLASPLMHKGDYRQFMETCISLLRRSIDDFKAISNPAHPRRSAEVLKAWAENTLLTEKLAKTLQLATANVVEVNEMLRLGNVDNAFLGHNLARGSTTTKNDLRITNLHQANNIQKASEDFAPIAEELQKIAGHSSAKSLL